jgi:hypothetical protein
MSPRGVCPDNRPKWLRCTDPDCRGTMQFRRYYRNLELWRCRLCGRTHRRSSHGAPYSHL